MSTILHFTKKYESLINILSDSSFRVFYCREVFYLGEKVASSAVHPMVSFSEQLIKSINRRNITYGKFGIGMNKEWVERKKLHPVLYLDTNSTVANALTHLIRARRKNTKVELAPQIRLSIITIKCFTKNSIGYNSKIKMKNFNFRSEKEWRFVPTKSQIGNKRISVTKRFYDKNPDKYNSQLIPFPLKFTKKDIKFIFVGSETQRDEISKNFDFDKKNIKISKWSTSRE